MRRYKIYAFLKNERAGISCAKGSNSYVDLVVHVGKSKDISYKLLNFSVCYNEGLDEFAVMVDGKIVTTMTMEEVLDECNK